MLAWKIAPALAAGNTVVLKPASTTPLTALLFAECAARRTCRRAWSTSSPGPARSAWPSSRHPDVDKVAFTGSTEVGKRIAPGVAGTDKALTLELGGKAANIVFDDAPLDQAVEGIVNGIYFNQGEVCCAGCRLLVQESIADVLIVKRLKDRLATIRVGDPLDKNTDVGAINSRPSWTRSPSSSRPAWRRAPTCTSRPATCPSGATSSGPTLFTNVAQSHRIAREEIFGPVLSVLTFRTPDEAVEKANNTPTACRAGIWTDKGSADPDGWSSGCGPASSGPTRSTSSTRPRPSAATRNPASAARAACTACRPTSWAVAADGRRGIDRARGVDDETEAFKATRPRHRQ